MSSQLTMCDALRRLFIAATIAGLGVVGAVEKGSDKPSEKQHQLEQGAMTGVLIVKRDKRGLLKEQLEQYAATHAFVGFTGIGAPMGRIVLMRRGDDLCAVRFTAFHRGADTPEGLFTYGGPSLYAEYDWYTLTLPRGATRPTLVNSGQRKSSEKPPYGISMLLSTGKGTYYVKCGAFKPWWSYPNIVDFGESSEVRDYGIELAPTNWQDIAEIDLANPHLQWYPYNEKRQDILIPLEHLPKTESVP